MRRMADAPARGRAITVWGSLLLSAAAGVMVLTIGSLLLTDVQLVSERAGAVELMAIEAPHPTHPVQQIETPEDAAADAPADVADDTPAQSPSRQRDAQPEAQTEARQSAPGATPSAAAPDSTHADPQQMERARAAASADQPAEPTRSAQREAASQRDAGRAFGGRKLEKVRTIDMTVTAYSPDARSCGKWADGITASGYSVWTNGMKLVAADTDLLPFGTIVTVPGYNDGKPVQVLDRGGAIKGKRLDVLYPTHNIARQWGKQQLKVTVWKYAD